MSRGCWQRTWRVPSAAASRSAPKILAIGFGQSSDALERRPEHLGLVPLAHRGGFINCVAVSVFASLA